MLKWIVGRACRGGMHLGGWVYVYPEQCNQRRVCGGCGLQSFRDAHLVADWVTDGLMTNKQRGFCIRCNLPQLRIKPSSTTHGGH